MANLKAMFNKAIKELRANGQYKAVNDKYADFDAYGDNCPTGKDGPAGPSRS